MKKDIMRCDTCIHFGKVFGCCGLTGEERKQTSPACTEHSDGKTREKTNDAEDQTQADRRLR